MIKQITFPPVDSLQVSEEVPGFIKFSQTIAFRMHTTARVVIFLMYILYVFQRKEKVHFILKLNQQCEKIWCSGRTPQRTVTGRCVVSMKSFRELVGRRKEQMQALPRSSCISFIFNSVTQSRMPTTGTLSQRCLQSVRL